MTITLTKTETTLLVEAAGQGGMVVIPGTTKPATRQRLLGRFERDGLVRPEDDAHVLTPAGYRAIGLRPSRQKRSASVEKGAPSPDGATSPGAVRTGTKRAIILDLLGRGEGATLDELIAVTDWLPHTTRAALSRIRSAGQALTKTARPDGTVAYRIEAAAGPAEPGSQPTRSGVASASKARTSPAPRGRKKAAGDAVQDAA
ncbi:DUF3489 domain-containing protein [Enterovirga sp. CN4-39]|uniref:DUF3489 domain-containing protein n=1 Tax=Enterovirga sp. CN4-39 TaxID=3400910 RepID=UPI003C0A18F9